MSRPAAFAIVFSMVGLADLVWIDAWLLPAWVSAAEASTASRPTIAAAALVTPNAPAVVPTVAPAPVVAPAPAPVVAPAPAKAAPPVVETAEVVVVEPEPEAATPSGPQRVPIYFVHTGSAELGEAARASLLALAGRMRDDAALRVVVRGHADARGTKRSNHRLSRRRAQAVAQELGRHGIAVTRISLAWFGERKPAIRGANPRAWAANRRVELEVKGGR